MTNDAYQRLCDLKDELVKTEPWPWSNIAAWSAKATPLIRRNWPDDLDDFREAVAEPRWIMVASVWAGGATAASDKAKQDAPNKSTAKQAKARILGFLEGLLAATEPPPSPVAVATDDPTSVRQQILLVILEIQGNSSAYTSDLRIAERLGLSVEEVDGHLEILRDQGKLRFQSGDKGCAASLTDGQKQRFKESMLSASTTSQLTVTQIIPPEITDSLKQFRKDYPDPSMVAFIMMRFGSTPAHNSIVEGIRSTLQPARHSSYPRR